MRKTIKTYVLRPDVWILTALFLPLLLHLFRFGHLHRLQGAIYPPPVPKISMQAWHQGSMQHQTEAWLKHYAGGRGPMLRLNNEFMYLAYDFARAGGVKTGYHGELYENAYWEDALGIYQPKNHQAAMDSLQIWTRWWNRLEQNGTKMLFIPAPSKAIHRPENLPNLSQPNANYHWLKTHAPQANKHVLDVQSWFDQAADSAKYPLMPKHGIHWSYYGEQLFLDSLLKRMESLELKGLPELQFKGMETSHWARFRDDDLEKGMNLIFNRKDETLAYPMPVLKQGTTSPEAKVLVISDSFYWGIFNAGHPPKMFAEHEFWYYYGSRFPKPKEGSSDLLALSPKERRAYLESRDLIIWISTSPNYWKMGLRFLADLHRMAPEFGMMNDEVKTGHFPSLNDE